MMALRMKRLYKPALAALCNGIRLDFSPARKPHFLPMTYTESAPLSPPGMETPT
jgi:hypothetical protein